MAEIFSNIKASIGRYIFHSKLKKLTRNKQMVHLERAKSIGLVYLVTDERSFKIIKLLYKTLSTKKCKIMVVGYINENEIPNFCIAADSGYYFCKKELNWFGGPKNDYLIKFIEKEFDILIDLTLTDNFILQYIAGLSKAKLKVGKYSEYREKYLDLMIDIKTGKPLEEFIDQTLHYLKILKSNHDE